jgi:hypothetical protein
VGSGRGGVPGEAGEGVELVLDPDLQEISLLSREETGFEALGIRSQVLLEVG